MKNPYSLGLVIILFISLVFIRLSDKNWGQNNKYGVLAWDNFGYYLYLPATFIYDDLKIESLDWVNEVREKYNPSSSFYQAHYLEGGTHVIQYTMGMAIIYMPAFWAGHLFALASNDFPADGFSAPYHLAILLYSLVLVAIGLFFLRKFGLAYFSDKIVALAIILLCFGSNYFQLVSTNTSSPNSILFTFYSILLFLVYKWHLKPTFQLSTLIALFFGIMVLARPNELVFCLIPLFWGVFSWSSFKKKITFFLSNYSHLLLMTCIIACIGLFQMMYWKFSSDRWIYDSYTNEDFKFLSPYLSEYLFSYKKGWLLYSPIFFLLVLGYYQLIKKSTQLALPLFIHFVISLWVLSSWDNWWYADSFSQRSIVQAYPVFLLPFAFSLKTLLKQKVLIKFFSFTLILLIISLNLFQSYQVRAGILHTQRMTKEYYWKIFGKTKVLSSAKRLLEPKRQINYLPQELNYVQKELYINKKSFELNFENPYSNKFTFAANEISENGYLYLNVIVDYSLNKTFDGELGVVFQTLDYRSKKYYSFINDAHPLKESPSLQTISEVYAPPHLRSMSDSIEVYLWLINDASIEVKQFIIECLDPIIDNSTYSNFSIGSAGKNNYWSSGISDNTNRTAYYEIDSSSVFSSTLERASNLIDFKSGKYEISVEGYNTAEDAEVYAVISLDEADETVFYKAFRIPNEKDSWEKWIFNGEIPESPSNESTLKFYLWSKSKNPFYYKELALHFY